MPETKHTPGPWRVYQEKPHYYSVGTDYANDRGHDQNVVRDVRKEANALLMAAAPDFYSACINDDVPELTRIAALRAVVQEVRRLGLANDEDPTATSEALVEVEQLLEGLQAAIRKARGEAPCK